MTAELYSFFGINALLVVAAAWLARTVIRQILNRDITRFQADLKQRYATELERTRADLRLANLDYEHRIASLNIKRGEVVAQLYELMVDFLEATEKYVSPVKFEGDPETEELGEILTRSANTFRKFYVKSRIYFSKEVCDVLDDLWKTIYDSVSKYSFWRTHIEYGRKDSKKELEAWQEAWSVMKNQIPEVTARIENEFRALLGVHNEVLKKESTNTSCTPTIDESSSRCGT